MQATDGSSQGYEKSPGDSNIKEKTAIVVSFRGQRSSFGTSLPSNAFQWTAWGSGAKNYRVKKERGVGGGGGGEGNVQFFCHAIYVSFFQCRNPGSPNN